MKVILFLFYFVQIITCYSQDVFFYETNQIRGFINPALTGLNGSLSFSFLAKQQYLNSTGDFLSSGVSVEQSWPCAKIDAGLFHIYDREGNGSFVTNHTGLDIVYTVPWEVGNTLNNLRLGSKIQYTSKSIDWSKLTFSDQIHSKYNLTDAYGVPNSTDFVAPAWHTSSRLAFGLGVLHKVEIGLVNKWSLTWGGAIENYTNVFENKGYDSILRLEKDRTTRINKWSFYISPEFSLTKSYRDYFGFRPSIVVLKERTLTNIQFGFDTNYRRAYGLGAYLSMGSFSDFRKDTKAFIINSYFRVLTTEISQLNVGIQYIHNIGGLSELFGQSIQMSLSYSFRKDGCASTPTTRSDCPSVSRKHQMMYDNIWFAPIEGINK